MDSNCIISPQTLGVSKADTNIASSKPPCQSYTFAMQHSTNWLDGSVTISQLVSLGLNITSRLCLILALYSCKYAVLFIVILFSF